VKESLESDPNTRTYAATQRAKEIEEEQKEVLQNISDQEAEIRRLEKEIALISA
tara:strand:+ start:2454 stop:2615 length:162 start_codon:yes stop_codon:yes gene_type:complete